MFNFLLSIISAFIIFFLRKALINKLIYGLIYYFVLVLVIVAFGVAGGGVTNDAYIRLHTFEDLERNNQLLDAKNKPTPYDGMLQIDLAQFSNSAEFKQYIQDTYEKTTGQAESVGIGLLFVIVLEIFSICYKASRRLLVIFKNKKKS